ncbi:MAG TPA: alpha-L-fucosidase, partial [Gemmatimonadales bacterium]
RGPGRRARPLARALPSARQLGWHASEVGIFVHFGVNTFSDREWGDGTEDPASFNPTALDCRQWARAAKSAGATRMVLTAKHHDGFCLWPSPLTPHSVHSSGWRGGQGDVVREFADACRAEGLGAGLYLSPWDRHEPSYGTPAYNDHYVGQLEELLSGYGPIVEVWFDGANGEGPNGKRQVYDWPRFFATVRRLQPGAVMFSDAGPDVRWIGNERGVAGDPNWCAVDPAVVPYAGADGPGIIEELQHGDPQGTVWRPGEADVSIRPGWFWHPAEDAKVRTGDDLLDLYFASVGRNSGLLLNVPPTRAGMFADQDVASLAAFGQRRGALFAGDLAANASVRNAGNVVELEWPRPIRFAVAELAEAIALGQVVESFTLAAWVSGAWVTCAGGTTIGHKRLARFEPVETQRVRLTTRSGLGVPRVTVRLYEG